MTAPAGNLTVGVPVTGLGVLVLAVLGAAALDWLLTGRVTRRRADRLVGERAPVPGAPLGGRSSLAGWLAGPLTSWPTAGSRGQLSPGSAPARPALASAGVRLAAAAGLVVVVVWVLGTTALGLGLPGPSGAVLLPLAGSLALTTSTAGWLAAQARARRRSAHVRAQVVEACEALASGLRAGLPPERLLGRAADDVSLLVPAATAARLGGEVGPALRSVTTTPGAERLAMLAAAWDVARRSGAGLADVVSRIATMVRADAGRQRQVDAALGGARSTARLFAVLPLLGIALGAGMDADPVGVLTESVVGAWLLCLGTALACLGLVWVERLAASARQ